MKARVITCESSRTAAARAVGAALAAVSFVLLWSAAASGEELSDIPAAFVDVGIGAGPMGMGGAVVATVEGPNALYWNPAGLALSDGGSEFSVSYCDQLGLVPYSAGAGTHRLGPYSLGLGLLYSGDEVLSETTLIVGAATEFHVLPWNTGGSASFGASARARWASYGNNDGGGEQVTGNAMGFGLDVGAVLPLTATTTLGVSARDVLNTLGWESSAAGAYDENVPTSLVAGIAMRPHERLLLEVDLDRALHLDVDDVVRAGAEIGLFGMASLRGGYRTTLTENGSDEYSIGGGATFPAGAASMTLDAAYLFGELDNTLRFSLGVAL